MGVSAPLIASIARTLRQTAKKRDQSPAYASLLMAAAVPEYERDRCIAVDKRKPQRVHSFASWFQRPACACDGSYIIAHVSRRKATKFLVTCKIFPLSSYKAAAIGAPDVRAGNQRSVPCAFLARGVTSKSGERPRRDCHQPQSAGSAEGHVAARHGFAGRTR